MVLLKWMIIYGIFNVFSFGLMLWDKHKAKKGGWRISERTLLLCAFSMGALGIYTGMIIAHHKTQHLKFRIGIPLALLENGIVSAILLFLYQTYLS